MLVIHNSRPSVLQCPMQNSRIVPYGILCFVKTKSSKFFSRNSVDIVYFWLSKISISQINKIICFLLRKASFHFATFKLFHVSKSSIYVIISCKYYNCWECVPTWVYKQCNLLWWNEYSFLSAYLSYSALDNSTLYLRKGGRFTKSPFIIFGLNLVTIMSWSGGKFSWQKWCVLSSVLCFGNQMFCIGIKTALKVDLLTDLILLKYYVLPTMKDWEIHQNFVWFCCTHFSLIVHALFISTYALCSRLAKF